MMAIIKRFLLNKAKYNKEKASKGIFRNNIYMFRLAWRISPGWVVLNFICNAVDQFGWVFNTVIFMQLVTGALESGTAFTDMLVVIAVLMAINAAVDAFQKWFYIKYSPEANLRSYEKLSIMLFDKAANVDLACYENPEFYNRYTLAVKEAGNRMGSVISSVSDIIILPATVVYVIYRMVLIDRYLLLFAIFPLIGTFVFDKKVQNIRYEKTLEDNINIRKKGYANRVFYLAQYAKEIRLSNVAKIINRLYEEGSQGTLAICKKYGRCILMPAFFHDIFSHIIIFYGVFLYGVYRMTVSKTMAVSEFVILHGALITVTMMLEYISENIMNCYQNALYIKNLLSFLGYKPNIPEYQQGEEVKRFEHVLEFRGVSFRYNGSDKEAIHNISLKIRCGEKIAIVGRNGAGKSTLIKLILRLYDPSCGEILLDNKNIKSFNLQDYRKLFSVAFQDQRVFSMSVTDNVSFDREKAIKALMQSGIWDKVQKLPHKENSILTREFDPEGVVLSGGETQKVNIARAFAKDFEIGIFDEPSGALDPIAEYKLFESMMEAFKDKTVIFISHRLSSAKMADRIYLIDNGTVLEEGSHEELMKKNGEYAKMFSMQAEKYIENEYAFLEGGLEL